MGTIKINAAKMVRNMLKESTDKVKGYYRCSSNWENIPKSESKRLLAIENMKKFERWIDNLDDKYLVDLVYKPGILNMLEAYTNIMFIIICTENERWVWKPRYILSLMILISYVVEFDWCKKHHIGVLTRGIMRCDETIRVGKYLKDIKVSKTHQNIIKEMYDDISHI